MFDTHLCWQRTFQPDVGSDASGAEEMEEEEEAPACSAAKESGGRKKKMATKKVRRGLGKV